MNPEVAASEKNLPADKSGLKQLVDKLFTAQTSYDVYFVERGLATPEAVREACRRSSPRWLDMLLFVAVATVVFTAANGVQLTVKGELAMPALLLYAHVAAVYSYLAFQLFRWAHRRTTSPRANRS